MSEGCSAVAGAQRSFNGLWFAMPLAIVAVLLRFDHDGLDLAISEWLYDPAVRDFPLRTTFFFETLLHHWAKYIVALIACLAWAGYLLTHAVPALTPHRRQLLFLGLALALAPATVTVLKLTSFRHCPWDIVQFGGYAPYLALLEPAPAGLPPGHCFPAGHASTGFCLMAFYFLGLSAGRRDWAWCGLALGLGAGLALGFGRIAQGAHFLSHVLWSGIVCWFVLLALYALILRPPEPRLR